VTYLSLDIDMYMHSNALAFRHKFIPGSGQPDVNDIVSLSRGIALWTNRLMGTRLLQMSHSLDIRICDVYIHTIKASNAELLLKPALPLCTSVISPSTPINF